MEYTNTFYCFLIIFVPCPWIAHSTQLTIQGCNGAGNADIVNTTVSPSLTCVGLNHSSFVYWSITRPSETTNSRVGSCDPIEGDCNYTQYLGKFNLSISNSNSTQLTFRDLPFSDGATINCSQDTQQASCKVYFIEEYKLKECKGGVLEVEENGTRAILCTGMISAHNIYWTVTSMNGTVQTPTTVNTPNTTNSLKVTKTPTTSTLTVKDHNGDLNGTNIVCSKLDNATMATCQVTVVLPKNVTDTVTDASTETGLTQTSDTETEVTETNHAETGGSETSDDETSLTISSPVVLAGGGTGGVILLIVVVALIVRRRRQRRRAQGSDRQHLHGNVAENQRTARESDFVEFVNDEYISADQLDAHRTAAAASLATLPKQGRKINQEQTGNDVYAQVQKKPKGDNNGKPKPRKRETEEGTEPAKSDNSGNAAAVEEDTYNTLFDRPKPSQESEYSHCGDFRTN